RFYYTRSRTPAYMPLPKLSKLELKIMEALWTKGASSVREIQESFPAKRRPAYTTVQTIVYRLEAKNALKRTKKIGNAHIFEAVISQTAARRKLIDDVLGLFGGRAQPLMSHLIESGQLTLQDIEEARAALREATTKE
ncbi:MAG TPA: BlaI/MecI/CopY family transcriptional regulator, partial [Gammaproteobacteria bacterium]|nr:BlaI/MecI/CopY family transcriptional regulator [Gammaproteobacteria bacterium]